jgi:hypothetical protein
LAKEKAPVIKELKKVERDLEAKQARHNKIQEIMADPANYENKELMMPLLEEEPAVAKDIKDLEARWEELQIKLEEIEEGDRV